jgi:hypothetical protein
MMLALLAASAVAQVNGVPASVTSVGTPGRGFAPGVPASVTSLGPFGWQTPPNCCPGATPLIPAAMGMRPPFFNVDVGSQGLQLGRQHHLHVRGGAPYVLPYPYPVGYPAAYPMYTDQAPVEEEDEEDAEPPAPTIFEHRRTSQWQAVEPVVASQPAPAAASEPQPAREQEPTLLVFKDGRQMEILNFAIAGDTLYELSPEYHKIPLTELNVPATVKANDARGTEFHVPPQKGS